MSPLLIILFFVGSHEAFAINPFEWCLNPFRILGSPTQRLPQPTVRLSNELNTGTNPLLRSIQEMGNPETPQHHKVQTVLRASDVLRKLGMTGRLVDDLAKLELQLQPLATQVMTRAPVPKETQFLEGRGVYQQVHVGDRLVISYTKGTGNERALNSGEFPCFPDRPEVMRLFYDRPGPGVRHPRVIGTETVTWGSLELVNASVVFAELVRTHKITTLEQALDAGVSIPLQVVRYGELTDRINLLVDQAIARSTNDSEKAAMNYSGNRDGLGAVQLIVPSTRRLVQTESSTDGQPMFPKAWKHSHTPQAVGATLRNLLSAGFVYSDRSSHAQNLYSAPEDRPGRVKGMAQADNSDLVFLGDLQGINLKNGTHFSERARRHLAIAKQIINSRSLFPPTAPLEGAMGWDEVYAAQKAFWHEMLAEAIPNIDTRSLVSQKIPYLMAIEPTATGLALGKLLYETAEKEHGKRWRKVANRKRKVLAGLSAFKVAQEYSKKIEDNIPNYDSDSLAQASKNFPVTDIHAFLKTGQDKYLEKHFNWKAEYPLVKTISKLDNNSKANSLLQSLVRLAQRERGFYAAADYDLCELCGFRHWARLSKLIQQGEIEQAEALVRVLELFPYADPGANYSFQNSWVPNRIAYPARLLEEGVPPIEVLDEANYQVLAGDIARLPGPSLEFFFKYADQSKAPEILRFVMSPGDEQNTNVVIYATLGARAATPDRQKIQEWGGRYLQALAEFDSKLSIGVWDTAPLNQLMLEKTPNDFPELLLAHLGAMYLRGFENGKEEEGNGYLERARALIGHTNSPAESPMLAAVKSLGYADYNKLIDRFPHFLGFRATDTPASVIDAQLGINQRLKLPLLVRYWTLLKGGDAFGGLQRP